ncbi:hypothetical protein IAU59_005221 [Kwoniella sp. CBS 9459]
MGYKIPVIEELKKPWLAWLTPSQMDLQRQDHLELPLTSDQLYDWCVVCDKVLQQNLEDKYEQRRIRETVQGFKDMLIRYSVPLPAPIDLSVFHTQMKVELKSEILAELRSMPPVSA